MSIYLQQRRFGGHGPSAFSSAFPASIRCSGPDTDGSLQNGIASRDTVREGCEKPVDEHGDSNHQLRRLRMLVTQHPTL
jgi:hypothetical protein